MQGGVATQGAPATPFTAKVIVAVTQAGVLASWQIIRKDQSAGLQLRDSAGLYPTLSGVAGSTGFAVSARSIRGTGA